MSEATLSLAINAVFDWLESKLKTRNFILKAAIGTLREMAVSNAGEILKKFQKKQAEIAALN